MARGKRTEDTTRAAVMAALLAGQGVNEVAAAFKLPQRTVSNIKKSIPPDKLAEVGSKKETDFGELVSGYLVATFKALTIQTEHFSDKAWLNEQSAADLAMLHGVQTDKAIRILEAIERASESANETDQTPSGDEGAQAA